MRTRAWLGRLLLMGVTLAVALVVAEVGLRVLGFGPTPGLFTVTEQEFQRVPGIFQPNQRVEQQPGTEFAHVATIDSLGYRGAHVPRAKPPGELRVLFAGDSFTWGHNVGDDETLPAQLEARLEAMCGAARVVNAGLSGSTILGQGELIRRGLAIDPDVVVLMFHENDIDELVSSRIWDQLAANRRVKSQFPISIVYPVARQSAILNLAQDIRRTRRARAEQPAPQGARTVAAGTEERVEAARREYEQRLASLVELLDERGVDFFFVAFPHPASVESAQGGPHYEWVLDVAAGMGLPTVNLLETLLETGEPPEENYLLPLDYHPNARGHGIAAGRVAAELLSSAGTLVCPR